VAVDLWKNQLTAASFYKSAVQKTVEGEEQSAPLLCKNKLAAKHSIISTALLQTICGLTQITQHP
jgi:hypothetical protein